MRLLMFVQPNRIEWIKREEKGEPETISTPFDQAVPPAL